jgi:hypothetical protein
LLRRALLRAGGARRQAEGVVTRSLARQLNRQCQCITLDRPALALSLRQDAGAPDFIAEFIETRANLFAGAPVFLSAHDAAAMMDVVSAVEAAARLPAYRDAVLAKAPSIARADHGPAGAFMGYDFHLTEEGPKLIEINTNAGGAFLNAFLARAQTACCTTLERAAPLAERFEAAVVAMFEREWARQRGEGRPHRIAIVDDDPAGQYLYPEFILAQRLLTRAGFEVVIADAAELRFEDGALRLEGRTIDLVYNRLVDFDLSEPAHAALNAAYRQGAVVVTPSPRNHALYANKRNLTVLSDAARMAQLGLAADRVEVLSRLPRAIEVTSANAETLWAERKRYFFKPAAGYGGKAVYRGDKLTRGAWESVHRAGYIAQDFAAPSERVVNVGGELRTCKLDVRLYVYDGRLLLAAARIYQGQATNFRTPGGGFAPVLII